MKDLEQLTDMETVLFLISHIDNPCSVQVEGTIVDIKNFYIRIAKEVLPRLENPWAADMLKSKIAEYVAIN